MYSRYSGHVYSGHSDIVVTFPGTKHIYSIIFRCILNSCLTPAQYIHNTVARDSETHPDSFFIITSDPPPLSLITHPSQKLTSISSLHFPLAMLLPGPSLIYIPYSHFLDYFYSLYSFFGHFFSFRDSSSTWRWWEATPGGGFIGNRRVITTRGVTTVLWWITTSVDKPNLVVSRLIHVTNLPQQHAARHLVRS